MDNVTTVIKSVSFQQFPEDEQYDLSYPFWGRRVEHFNGTYTTVQFQGHKERDMFEDTDRKTALDALELFEKRITEYEYDF